MSTAPSSVDMLKRLVAFDTTSRNSNLALIEYVREYLQGHGVASKLVPSDDGTKANLFATLGEGKPSGIILSGHTDTVPAQGNFPGRIEDGWVHGLGATDMKGGLAVALELARDVALGEFA